MITGEEDPLTIRFLGRGWRFLAGDALLTMAFELCSQPTKKAVIASDQQIQIIQELAMGSGHGGMVGGQVLDIQAENQDIRSCHTPNDS